jgi:N-acetylneuraminic acid mutarotase
MMQKKLSEMNWLDLVKLGIICSILLSVSACGDDDDDDDLVGNWVELSFFEGIPRSDAVGISLDGKAYVATGWDGDDLFKDLWEYDPAQDQWRQKAEFPGVARIGAVGFGASGKLYVGTGYDRTFKLKDFYEYDPLTNEWIQIADFEGSARYGAIAMTIGDKGYVGTGFDSNYLKDFWAYDPSTGAWTQKTSVGGSKRRDATAFVIDDIGYVCGGINNGTYEDDFWKYDPAADNWTSLRDISDATDEDFDDDYAIVRTNAVAFVVNGKAYIATGGRSTTGGDVWEYNPATDLWVEKTGLAEDGSGGADRTEAVGFTIDNVGYIATGRNSSYYFDDVWRFEPNAEMNEYD